MLQEEDPFLTRELLKNYLLEDVGMSEASMKQALNYRKSDRMIGILINAGIIEMRGNGWAVIDDFTYSIMMLRNQKKCSKTAGDSSGDSSTVSGL